ncbi:MAG: hypothetical protein UHI81_02850 [Olegusella sp.]|nr:hypothetical protein [Olegusella sp.]
MNVSQAIELASSLFIPEFLFADGVGAVEAERERTEEAIRTLRDDWFAQPAGKESYSFDLVRELADRNRTLCDLVETSDDPQAQAIARRREDSNGMNLTRSLSEQDLVRGVAALQRRSPAKVAREVNGNLDNLAVAYVAAPIKGSVVGIDLETTGRNPDRGYIINVGWETMDLTPDAHPEGGEAVYCGLPPAWAGRPVPLERVHHITPDMLAGHKTFREDKDLQKRLLKLLRSKPFMAHNAAFEDSWLMLFLDGYAEGRKAGKIIPIDTRDICRRVDIDMRGLPRESHPATLENWARRRGTLDAAESEQHLGLDDTDLMLRTVQAEFVLRNMFPGAKAPDAAATDAAAVPGASNGGATSTSTTSDAAATNVDSASDAHSAHSTREIAAIADSPTYQEAVDRIAAGLIAPLQQAALQGTDMLGVWAATWVSHALATLPKKAKKFAGFQPYDGAGFAATLASASGTDVSGDPEAKTYEAPLDPHGDQVLLAKALASFAGALAVAAATEKKPKHPVSLVCRR